MQSITILNRTTKTEGAVCLRFRLRDGRAVDITHRSGIKAELSELEKLDATGTPRKGMRIYSRSLAAEIAAEVATMRTAYSLLCADDAPRNNKVFARYVERVRKNPQGGAGDIETRFAEWQRDAIRDKMHGESAASFCRYAGKILHRFLRVESLEGIKPSAFDSDKVLRLREFATNEHLQVLAHPAMYADEKSRQIPKRQRGRNTIAVLMRVYSTFFTELEDAGEIERSPFAKISKEKRKRVFRVQYNTPIYCTAEELHTLRTAEVPEDLEETRTAFVLQCAIGCRMSDYRRLTMHNIATHPNGFLYVHYLPQKTHEAAASFAEVETPLVKYAAEIVASRGGFAFECLHNRHQYNCNIRRLFECCGLRKECAVYNEASGQNEYKPMHEQVSSKTARKTAVNMLTKAQVNLYAAGLHTKGSGAIRNYTELTTADRYALMCYAYGEKPYKAQNGTEIVEYTTEE